MANPSPQVRNDSQRGHPPKPHIDDLEATGLLIIAVLIFILTLVRYWHHIGWSAR